MTPESAAKNGAEQRRERRYKVDLWGEIRFEDGAIPVRIGDLSASGAFLYLDNPPPRGCVVTLYIQDYGEIEMEIMHATDKFCGVAMKNPAEHRGPLLEWLRQEVLVDSETGWAAQAGET